MDFKKLKGFTILELMIVMLLTTIVVALAYSGSALFFKEYLLYKGRAEKTSSISLLDRLMAHDFSTSVLLLKRQNGFGCIHSNKTVNYQFENEYILRRDSMVLDTFYIKANHAVMNFLGNAIQRDEVIDELLFDMENKEEVLYFHYHKKYGADVLVNKTTNSFNVEVTKF